MKTLIGVIFLFVLTGNSLTGNAQANINNPLDFRNVQDLPYRLSYAAYASDKKNLYAVNGLKYGSVYSTEILKYNAEANQWSVLTDKLLPKINAVAAYVEQMHAIYIFGGQLRDNIGLFMHVEVVDVSTGKVTKLKAANPMPATNCGIAVWNNKIYLFGGSEAYGNAIGSYNLYEFDPATTKFKLLNHLPQGGLVSGTIVDGTLYTFGGFDRNTRSMTKNIYAYNIAANTWKQVGKLPEYISGTAVTSWQNYIILAGSYPDQKLVGYFNSQTFKFVKANSNMLGRRFAGAGIIDNHLYVFGGNLSNSFPGIANTQVANLQAVTEAAQ